jgi:2-keto-3-deoxy-L-rhamnonate aldolase RhmA
MRPNRVKAPIRSGQGTGGGHAGGLIPDFVEQANAHTLVRARLGSAAGIGNAREILDVSGVDAFFIGPSDPSQSMLSSSVRRTFRNRWATPQSNGAADRAGDTLALIRGSGRVPCMPATVETLAEVFASACLYVNTHLPRLPGTGADAFLPGRPAV